MNSPQRTACLTKGCSKNELMLGGHFSLDIRGLVTILPLIQYGPIWNTLTKRAQTHGDQPIVVADLPFVAMNR